MKIAIKILNKKHSRVTQELLFSHGYRWCSSGVEFNYYPDNYIEIDARKRMMNHSQDYGCKILRLKELKEHLTNIS